jgi:hypothetical protein
MAARHRAHIQEEAQARASAIPCPDCGHSTGEHRELPVSWRAEGFDIVEVKHPEYVEGRMICECRVDGCECRVDASELVAARRSVR